ncbi:MAG: fibronectin type III domain-containing protein, partial [Deltaproteobacteria bacterium]|nr:fibronectin type III domain-containing protein [Deltaproteobacteria bacterium]
THIATVNEDTQIYTDSALTDGTTYYYRTRAFNGAGNSGYSNEDNEATYIIAPTGLSASGVSSSRIELSWSDNSAAESGYKIERKAGSSGVYSQVAVVGANSVAWSNAGLSASSTYYYRVRAYNSTGNSDYSNESSATTLAVSAGSSGGSSGGGCFVSSLL